MRAGSYGDIVWFRYKFKEDLSDFNPEHWIYYKHHACHFISGYFTRERIGNKRVLDFGCGPGVYSVLLAKRGAVVTGIDLSAFLIEKAKQFQAHHRAKNVTFFTGDLLDVGPSWDECSFDVIIAIDVLVSLDHGRQEHNHTLTTRILSELRRLLKKGGKLYIGELHPCFGPFRLPASSDDGEQYWLSQPPQYKIKYKPARDPHHWFTLEEMTQALHESGLAVTRIFEPEPSLELKSENPFEYEMCIRFPLMIVYEVRRL